MGKMYKIIFFLFALELASISLYAKDYCSLIVRVISPDGRRPGTWIRVIEKNGDKIQLEVDPGKDTRICDLGILPVDVEVGLPGCNYTIIKDVPLKVQETYFLSVIYDPMPCIKEVPPLPVPLCKIMFKVVTETQAPIAGSSIVLETAKGNIFHTDSAGRAFVNIPIGVTVEGVVRSTGYESKHINIMCSRETRIQEKLIKLIK